MARICENCIHNEVCNEWAVTSGIPFISANTCENFMTADVAPKSEVDRVYQRGFERGKRDNVCGFSAEDIAQKAEKIAIELEAMRMAANSYKMHYENARAEVAREIFEEIEQWLGNYNGCRVITYEKFAELKKKYTEEN